MEELEMESLGLGFEDYDETETTSAWDLHFRKELNTRKYGEIFGSKIDEVYEWVYAHKEIIWDTPFEEQERMMIEDGVLTPEDIRITKEFVVEELEMESLGLGFEDYDETETTSAWDLHFRKELNTRKYGEIFGSKIDEVYEWVYAHKDIIWDTPFEEQERMMIEDGVLTPEDI